MRPRPLGILLAAAIVLSAAGCSGGSKDEGITKAQFLKEANRICKATRTQVQASAENMDPSDPSALSKYITEASTEVLDEIAQLRDVGFPAGDDKLLDQAFSVYEDTLTEWQSDPSAAATGAGDKRLQAAGKVLEDYGLPSCGTGVTKGQGG